MMKKEELIRSAQLLKAPSATATKEFDKKIDAVAAELTRRMLARPDLERLIGADNQSMMENNSRNFCRFMEAIFQNYEPAVLVETALWAFRAYRAHGFQISYWPANLDTLVEILKEELKEPAYGEVYPFFDWLIVHIPAFVQISDGALMEGAVAPEHR
jgi:hypothetical protein